MRPNRVTTEDDDDMDSAVIRRVGPDVYLLGDIDNQSVMSLIEELHAAHEYHLKRRQEIGEDFSYTPEENPIRLHLNTPGGLTFAGLSASAVVRNFPWVIDTYIIGDCSSSGTFISIVGRKRYMSRHSAMLIHQISHGVEGKHTHLQETVISTEKVTQQLVALYKEFSKMTKDEITTTLKNEVAYLPPECKKKGLIDEIL